MSNSKGELIQSVRQIFTKAIEDKITYVIPSYQRGYKWNRDNVAKLLDDLKNFELGNASNPQSFYCIQNITIVPTIKADGWHVVDGQQRLTTLYILLSFLRKFHNNKDLYFFSSRECLRYSVRKDTEKVLRNDIYGGKIWEKDIDPNKAKHKDEWYILDVAQGIKDWFITNGNSLKIDTITNRLKLIVNSMSSESASEEEIFAGLNGGKVDLDGTDLVRAELITRSAKEKYQNALVSKVKEFRMRIAIELDEMSLWWGHKEQTTYFKQFLPEKFNDNIFNHSIHPLGLLYKLYFLIHQIEGEKFGIEFFENGRNYNGKHGDDHWELYETIMHLHRTLRMWFSDQLLYHWIGFIMFRFKGQPLDFTTIEALGLTPNNASVGFKLIWQIWNNSASKEVFISKLIFLVKYMMSAHDDQFVSNIRNPNRQWYGNDSKGIIDVLVLMDVMKCTGIYKDLWKDEDLSELKTISFSDFGNMKLRLPASYFTKYHENFEHIRSCAPNSDEGKEEKSKQVWIQHITRIYDDAASESAECQMKSSLLSILEDYKKEELDDAVIKKLNQEMNKYGQHSIGNMALLDEHVNKSYGNAPFQNKIQRIFSEYMNDAWYIRPYTMIVFEHKIEDSDKSWRWTQQNIRENARNIANNVERFMNYKL